MQLTQKKEQLMGIFGNAREFAEKKLVYETILFLNQYEYQCQILQVYVNVVSKWPSG
jgi:hypothetical protein